MMLSSRCPGFKTCFQCSSSEPSGAILHVFSHSKYHGIIPASNDSIPTDVCLWQSSGQDKGRGCIFLMVLESSLETPCLSCWGWGLNMHVHCMVGWLVTLSDVLSSKYWTSCVGVSVLAAQDRPRNTGLHVSTASYRHHGRNDDHPADLAVAMLQQTSTHSPLPILYSLNISDGSGDVLWLFVSAFIFRDSDGRVHCLADVDC